jgi:hypothetical protein
VCAAAARKPSAAYLVAALSTAAAAAQRQPRDCKQSPGVAVCVVGPLLVAAGASVVARCSAGVLSGQLLPLLLLLPVREGLGSVMLLVATPRSLCEHAGCTMLNPRRI